jgi:hypothetical protein
MLPRPGQPFGIGLNQVGNMKSVVRHENRNDRNAQFPVLSLNAVRSQRRSVEDDQNADADDRAARRAGRVTGGQPAGRSIADTIVQ